MKTHKNDQWNDSLMDESDEYLLDMMEDLKLELNDIIVSDELIAKTLAKVSIQENTKKQAVSSNLVPLEDIIASSKPRRNYNWIRSFSVVAAACLVLFLGINAMKNVAFMGSKKDTASYDWKADNSMNSTTEAYDIANDTTAKSAAPEALQGNMKEEATADTTDRVLTAEKDMESSDTGAGPNGNSNLVSEDVSTVTVQNVAYARAFENAMNEAANLNKVYEYLDSSTNDQAKSLLELFTSDQLTVSLEEPSEEWQYYMVFSLGEEDAVMYQVGEHYVIATNYHNEEEPSQVIYDIKDENEFKVSILEQINK